jgi:hypothetical protein
VGEIRTHGPVARSAVFKTAALNHSATTPRCRKFLGEIHLSKPCRRRHRRHPNGSLMALRVPTALGVIAALTVTTVACDGDADPVQWMLQVDTLRSETDGTVRLATTLEVLGKDGLEGHPRDRETRLRFECRRGTGAFAAVLTTGHLASGTAALRIRLDSLPPYSAVAAAGSYGEWGMVYTSEWSALLDSLRGHRSMLLEYSALRTPRTVAEFSVAGIDSLRPLFLAACSKR